MTKETKTMMDKKCPECVFCHKRLGMWQKNFIKLKNGISHLKCFGQHQDEYNIDKIYKSVYNKLTMTDQAHMRYKEINKKSEAKQ